ncbi:transaldolase family protein [Nocardia sp. NPDC051981]|uniref:transaldolase family protein n=1 Tax=Nocardia sp. NPDC051981 TaxID=3155417 RepID=UPI003415D195
MPEATLQAVADHGLVPADSIHGTYPQARQVLDELAAVGVDCDDVVAALEADGVAKFDASWDQLGTDLAHALTAPAAR